MIRFYFVAHRSQNVLISQMTFSLMLFGVIYNNHPITTWKKVSLNVHLG